MQKLEAKTEHYCVSGRQHVCGLDWFTLCWEVLVIQMLLSWTAAELLAGPLDWGQWVTAPSSADLRIVRLGGSLIFLWATDAGCHIPTSVKHDATLIPSPTPRVSHTRVSRLPKFPVSAGHLASWWQCFTSVPYFISTWICEKLYFSGFKKIFFNVFWMTRGNLAIENDPKVNIFFNEKLFYKSTISDFINVNFPRVFLKVECNYRDTF